MTLHIAHSPDTTFQFLPFTAPITVDLNRAVHRQLSEGEQLTNDKALQILKNIKWQSDLNYLLAKPVVLISISIIFFTTGMLIPITPLICQALRAILCGIGAGLFGYTVENSLNGFLGRVSYAYSEQSRLASEYIERIEASNTQLEFVLSQ